MRLSLDCKTTDLREFYRDCVGSAERSAVLLFVIVLEAR